QYHCAFSLRDPPQAARCGAWRRVLRPLGVTAVGARNRTRRIAERLDWHYTARHGSWLNMADVELAALGKQCLGRRIASAEELRREVAAWQELRNESQADGLRIEVFCFPFSV